MSRWRREAPARLSADSQQIAHPIGACHQRKLVGMTELPNVDFIEGTIHVIRGQRVMLDADLARRISCSG